MSKWKMTINIKEALTDDVSAEGIKKASAFITTTLRQKTSAAPISRFQKASEIADNDPETALLVFNDAMDRLYDWADESRVWLE